MSEQDTKAAALDDRAATAIVKALAALRQNDRWHKDHDDHDGYQDSKLQWTNLAAIQALERLSAPPAAPEAAQVEQLCSVEIGAPRLKRAFVQPTERKANATAAPTEQPPATPAVVKQSLTPQDGPVTVEPPAMSDAEIDAAVEALERQFVGEFPPSRSNAYAVIDARDAQWRQALAGRSLGALMLEVERLRTALAAIDKHSMNTLSTNSRDRDDWADDVVFMGQLARDRSKP